MRGNKMSNIKTVPTQQQQKNVHLLAAIGDFLLNDEEFYKGVISKFSKEELNNAQTYADRVGYSDEFAASISNEEYCEAFANMIKEIIKDV